MPCRKLVYGETLPSGQRGYSSLNDCNSNSCCDGSSNIIRDRTLANAGLNGPCPDYCISPCDHAWSMECAGGRWIYWANSSPCPAEQGPPDPSLFCSSPDLSNPYIIPPRVGNTYVWRSPSIPC